MEKTNLIGKRFGRLVVIAEAPSKKSPCGSTRTYWKCRCDCGNVVEIGKAHLLNGDSTSCGCYRKEVTLQSHLKHGERHSRIYKLWCSMKQRCTDHGAEKEVYYDRGIRVCDEWANSFEAFRDWALSHGYDPNAPRGTTTIDRIDNTKGYSPDNCKFSTLKEQARNKTTTKKAMINGVEKPLIEWCEVYCADYDLARARIARGWDALTAITKPPRKLKRRIANE